MSSSSTPPPSESPNTPSCLLPSSLALWVSKPASTLAPASRPASPSTSAITFLGEPFRSSSTMHQYAVAMSDRLRVLAQRADELFHRVLDLALDDPPRRPRRSEEHTSELQSQSNLVCRLLLEK